MRVEILSVFLLLSEPSNCRLAYHTRNASLLRQSLPYLSGKVIEKLGEIEVLCLWPIIPIREEIVRDIVICIRRRCSYFIRRRCRRDPITTASKTCQRSRCGNSKSLSLCKFALPGKHYPVEIADQACTGGEEISFGNGQVCVLGMIRC